MPTVYTSVIGDGAGANYATVGEWYTASAGAGYYDDGDEIIAVLQSSATGHDDYHDLAGSQYNWPDDKEITITFSSTKLAGSGPPDGWLRIGQGFTAASFESSATSKTINFKNLDIQMYQNTINMSPGILASASSQVNYDRCIISGLGSSNDFNRVGSTVGDTSGLVTYNFTNCLIRSAVIVKAEANICHVKVNAIGCVMSNNASLPWMYPNNDSDSHFEVHFSGVVGNWARTTPTRYNGPVTWARNGWTSGTATDYISNEYAGGWQDSIGWANTQTNVVTSQTFAYGSAPGDGVDIAFLGNNLQTYTEFSSVFTNTDGDDNLRLWDSVDNAASGFVSNVTLPSPDLAGRNRGSSPFDAGPYEITAGSVGPIDTRPTFKIVRVNMYN
jgi:hypothetical protein